MTQSSASEKKLKWEEKVRQQRESGLSITKWCRQNQIHLNTFRYWKDKFFSRAQLTRSCFTELPVGRETCGRETGISIEYRGIRIHIDKHFDPSTLKSCLSVLKGVSC